MGNCVSGTKTVTVEPPLRTSSALEVPKVGLVDKVNEDMECEATSSKHEDLAQDVELRSVSVTDEFESTELDLSFREDDSEDENNMQVNNPSSCEAVYTRSNTNYTRRDLTFRSFTSSPSDKPPNSVDTVMPRSEYSSNRGSRNSEIVSSSGQSSLENLPKVTESGNLDLENFKEIVLGKIRSLSAENKDKSRVRSALRLVRRLDNAVLEAMNKVKKATARRSAKVAPLVFALDNTEEQKALQSNEKAIAATFGDDVLDVSDCEDD